MIDKTYTGRNIAALRTRNHLSQTDLAERIHVTPQAVSKWENGRSLPDLDSLLELSYLFGVTINTLVDSGAAASAQTPSLLPIVNALSKYYTDAELHLLSTLPEDALQKMTLSMLSILDNALSSVPKELCRIADLLICPHCGSPLTLETKDGITLNCPEHHTVARYVDGILCFDVTEAFGNEWSKVFRNYEEFLDFRAQPFNPNYLRGLNSQDIVWEELAKRQPKLIVDIATGEARGIEHYINKIDWNCTIVLTDLSYRILKWDRRYFENTNPYVTFVYIACDGSNLPLRTNSADAVVSFGGYVNMDDKCWDGFRETHRILKQGGAAIFDLSTLDDRSSANTSQWLKLTRSISWITEEEVDTQFLELIKWKEFFTTTGFASIDSVKLYDELPAPAGDTFPFPNAIMQWMSAYVICAEK